MGMVHHNAVLATTWDGEKAFPRVWSWVQSLPEKHRHLFVKVHSVHSVLNGYMTIALSPDGSKEGWPESDDGDRLRAAFIAELKKDDYEDGSNPWNFVEVGYGELGAQVVSTNCKNRYK